MPQALNAGQKHSAIILTCDKLPSVFKTFILSIFEWPLKKGVTVLSGMWALQSSFKGLSLVYPDLVKVFFFISSPFYSV